MNHLRLERFQPAIVGDSADDRTAGWLAADSLGFHARPLSVKQAADMAATMSADGRILTAVYDDGLPEHSLGGLVPVATYATMAKTLNAGGGRFLDAHLVTSVSVRASHRRQGLLRRMMTEDLRRAASEGLPVAALTASEGTIYGRFGFGPAAFARRVQVDTSKGALLAVPPPGSVHPVDPGILLDVAPALFSGFHAATKGSIDRPDSYRLAAAGHWRDHGPRRDKDLRAALHYDDGGRPDGYVTYRFRGWESEPRTVDVVDMVAADPTAYLGLWGYLGSLDLVDRVDFPLAAVEDPLQWALQDTRAYRVVAEEDALWLRILDVVTALEAREYAADGVVVLHVGDPLGLAAGTFRLDCRDGRATVTRVDETVGEDGGAEDGTADVHLDVAALGSLYLGAAHPTSLAAAGRIGFRGTGSREKFTAIFGVSVGPNCLTRF